MSEPYYVLSAADRDAIAKLLRDTGLNPPRRRAYRRGRNTRSLSPVLGKTNSAINVDSSGSISVYVGTMGSETDAGFDLSVFNKFADVGDSAWVWAQHNGWAWYLTAGRCTT